MLIVILSCGFVGVILTLIEIGNRILTCLQRIQAEAAYFGAKSRHEEEREEARQADIDRRLREDGL